MIFKLKMVLFGVAFIFMTNAHSKEMAEKAPAKNKDAAEVIGWIDGTCFAVKQKDLRKGVDIFVVTLESPQTISSAKLLGPAKREKCGALAADRREHNVSQGLSFYEIKSAATLALGIGVLGKVTNTKVKDNLVLADVGGDGKIERFSLCATSEGLSFDVWNSEPFTQKPVWSGYYYLGYDVERTCP